MPKNHEYYMSIALHEAKKGLGYTSPNPLVGSVIVKNNKILSTGYHEKYGENHAEVNAINKLSKNQLKDSTIYITLEPCCHQGNTPPCTDAIINSKIKTVVIANEDIDKRVKNKSIKILNNKGIKVITGILKDEAYKMNSIYFYNKSNNKPYIVLKSALTLDGKIAVKNGNSKWISNEKSRELVHKLRLRLKSIAVGKNTIIKDKPRLNCRLENYESKPVDKLIFSNEKLETSSFGDNKGNVYFLNKKNIKTKIDFIKFCNEKNIDSILVEGGGKLYTWFLENNLVDRIFLFYKPSFMGIDGISIFQKSSPGSIKYLKEYKINEIEKIDNNFMIDLYNGEPICLLA